MSRYRGEVPVEIDGQHLTLKYDYAAIALINEKLGPQGHMLLIGATSSCDVKTLMEGVAIGLQANHPDLYTLDKLTDLTPPIRLMQEAVYEAMMSSWYGPDGKEDENPPVSLWNQLRNWWTRLLRLKNTHSNQA